MHGGTHLAKNIKLRRSEILYFSLLGEVTPIGSVGAPAAQRCPPDTRNPKPFERTEAVRRKNLFAYYVLLSYHKLSK